MLLDEVLMKKKHETSEASHFGSDGNVIVKRCCFQQIARPVWEKRSPLRVPVVQIKQFWTEDSSHLELALSRSPVPVISHQSSVIRSAENTMLERRYWELGRMRSRFRVVK
jgi:hypothetical protein